MLNLGQNCVSQGFRPVPSEYGTKFNGLLRFNLIGLTIVMVSFSGSAAAGAILTTMAPYFTRLVMRVSNTLCTLWHPSQSAHSLALILGLLLCFSPHIQTKGSLSGSPSHSPSHSDGRGAPRRTCASFRHRRVVAPHVRARARRTWASGCRRSSRRRYGE